MGLSAAASFPGGPAVSRPLDAADAAPALRVVGQGHRPDEDADPAGLQRTGHEFGRIADQPRVEPVYEEVEGWPGSTRGARSWADLPAQAVKYVRRIEELIRCPVALVSTSPQRDDTILVSDPFAG